MIPTLRYVIHCLLVAIGMSVSLCAVAAMKHVTSPVLGSGAFSQTYTFTTSANYRTYYPFSGSTINLMGRSSQFSSLSFQLQDSSGVPLASPASLATFNATSSGGWRSASFTDGYNTSINLSPSTSYLILVSGVASASGVQYYMTGNYLMPGSKFELVPAVPEPETYTMLMAGIGLIGVVSRRRKKKALAQA